MSDPITLSAEAWAAISAISLPLTAALASNIRLSSRVKNLSEQIQELSNEMGKIITHEGRLLRLETHMVRAQMRKQRK